MILTWQLQLAGVLVYCACTAANQGASSVAPIVNMNYDAGWYYGFAGDTYTTSTVFQFNVVSPGFRLTIVDAFCPGDVIDVTLYFPGGFVYTYGVPGPLSPFVDCSSPSYTTNPNVAFADFTSFSQSFVIYPDVGTWKLQIRNGSSCTRIGVYARIDSLSLTNTVCAFNTGSNVITDPAKMVQF